MMILLLLWGLIIGSFLGALTYRLPRNISVSKGRSKCPNCNEEIRWYDNVPLFSYLILKGRCRSCGVKISPRYPLIELGTAISFLLIGPNIFNLILGSILIAIFVIDLENQIIPDNLVFIGLFIVLLEFITFNSPLFTNLLAGFVAALILLFLNLITKGKGMGLGDVKLAILIGCLAGIEKIHLWLFFSFLTGAIVGIILILMKKAKLKEEIAFGPFLIIGYLLLIYFK